jgi:large subunit ribosomal protein L32
MAVPKRKISKSRKNLRRSHLGLRTASLGRCPRCNQAAMRHRICPNCGYYGGKSDGRTVIDREGL